MKKKEILKEKKGISGIITVVILIALVLAASAIVWGIVQNLVGEKLEEASSCFEVFEKLSLNREYTCYDSSAKEMLFSVTIGDASINNVSVLISGEGSAETIEIPSSNGYTKMYKGDYSQDILLPGKNSGRTYVVNLEQMGFSESPISISIYPIVGGKRCQVSDTVYEIPDCFLFDLD